MLSILEELSCTKENLVASIKNFIQLPASTGDKLLNTIQSLNSTNFSNEERDSLLQKARSKLHWINNYGGEEFHIYTSTLNEMLKKFEPVDVFERVGWLLSTPLPQLLEGEPKEHEAKDKLIKTKQIEAAREILNEATFEKILTFSRNIHCHHTFGYSLALAMHDERESDRVLDAFLSHMNDVPMLIKGYTYGRIEAKGKSWIDGPSTICSTCWALLQTRCSRR